MPKKIDNLTKEKILLNQQLIRQLLYKDFDKMREAVKKRDESKKKSTPV
jgi:hypothetical protein